MDTPTCPDCQTSLIWRDPTDTLRSQMSVGCHCTDVDFDRSELAATSTGPESKAYAHPSVAATKQDGRDLRKDVVEYWGEEALRWIEEKAGIACPA